MPAIRSFFDRAPRGRPRGAPARRPVVDRRDSSGGGRPRGLLTLGLVMSVLGALGCDDAGGVLPMDGSAIDAGPMDAARPDQRVVDEGLIDATRPDLSPPDEGFDDLGPLDMGADAQGPADMMASDLGTDDMGLGDSGLGDSGLGDSGLGDSGLGDMDLGDDGARPASAARPAVVAGGGTVTSARYVLRVSVGGPVPTATTRSNRLRARLGVALPRIASQEIDP